MSLRTRLERLERAAATTPPVSSDYQIWLPSNGRDPDLIAPDVWRDVVHGEVMNREAFEQRHLEHGREDAR